MSIVTYIIIIFLFLSAKNVLAKNIKTDYNLSFENAVEMQMNANAKPITSVYAKDWSYVDLRHIQSFQKAVPTGREMIVRKEPNWDSAQKGSLYGSLQVAIVGPVNNNKRFDADVWYEVMYQGEKGYVHGSHLPFLYVNIHADTPVLKEPNEDAHPFGLLSKPRRVVVGGANLPFLKIPFDHWRFADEEVVSHYMQPGDVHQMQHLRLDKLAHVSAEQINDVLVGKGILAGEGAAFVEGATTAEINEAYLLAHAFLETGHGTSPLASGVEVGENAAGEVEVVTEGNRDTLTNIQTVYNMFGIEAVDSCPVECGAIKAYETGWTSPAIAIREGAKWIGSGYIYNEFEQNTLYKMRWNPQMKDGAVWKQYATDVGWAVKQTGLLEEIYNEWDNPDRVFDYPVYEE